jgi:hypothetical protein
MGSKKIENKRTGGEVTIQLNLTGLIIFSVALILAAALVTYGLVEPRNRAGTGETAAQTSPNLDESMVVAEATNFPPCGQLVLRDLDLEQPEEYVAYEINTNKVTTWIFEGIRPEAAQTLMQSCGLTAEQIARLMSPECLVYTNSSTIVTPPSELVLSLVPATRAKFYLELAHYSSNELMHFPFCFPGNAFETRFDKSKISGATYALLKQMLYPRGDAECFSDLQTLLHQVPGENERLQLVKALSHQTALLCGIHVWPDTDIDKLVGYWAWPEGVRLINMRPLLESLKRRPAGGSASILYFLPPFARERLYSYPLPSQLGDPTMDCHWSTMNFFNEKPDNRFSDPVYTVAFLKTNYYPIAKATAYGDRIFLLDENGNAIHSAVLLADDIIFTKNGNNFAQPWMLMHLKDLIDEYTTDVAPGMAVYRDRRW